MPRYLNTIGNATLGIGICARCQFKFALGELQPDVNIPGLLVCERDRDDFDPYRMAARMPDRITLPFVRPDVVLTQPDPVPEPEPFLLYTVALIDGEVISETNPVPTEDSGIAPVGGGIVWGAVTTVAMTGVSMVFVPANTSRRALVMWNIGSNDTGAIDISGGTVTLASGWPFSAVAQPISFSGVSTPTGVVTAIGTNTQLFCYQEGL